MADALMDVLTLDTLHKSAAGAWSGGLGANMNPAAIKVAAAIFSAFAFGVVAFLGWYLKRTARSVGLVALALALMVLGGASFWGYYTLYNSTEVALADRAYETERNLVASGMPPEAAAERTRVGTSSSQDFYIGFGYAMGFPLWTAAFAMLAKAQQPEVIKKPRR